MARGFDQVFIYLHDRRLIRHVKNVTWVLIPWLENTPMHYGGQHTAVQHCLYHNKEVGTRWVLFADVDEYVVVTKTYATATNLVRASMAISNKTTVAAYDYGQYIIRSALQGSNDLPMAERILFNSSQSAKGEGFSHFGHRKQLINVRRVTIEGVHSIIRFAGRSHNVGRMGANRNVHHFHPTAMASLHVKMGQIPYTVSMSSVQEQQTFLCTNHSWEQHVLNIRVERAGFLEAVRLPPGQRDPMAAGSKRRVPALLLLHVPHVVPSHR